MSRQEELAEMTRREIAAVESFRSFVSQNRDELKLVASWSDGRCGYLIGILRGELLGERAE